MQRAASASKHVFAQIYSGPNTSRRQIGGKTSRATPVQPTPPPAAAGFHRDVDAEDAAAGRGEEVSEEDVPDPKRAKVTAEAVVSMYVKRSLRLAWRKQQKMLG